MAFNKKFFTTGGIVASSPTAAEFDPLQNFETVTYTGNGGTQKITGYIRKGAAFNGSSSYINLNGSVISVGSFSVSLWVNWNDVTNQSRAFHLGDGDGFSDISIFALSGNAVVRFADSGSNYRDVSFSVSANQWYHIAMTYDISNNNYKVFLNGVQQGSTIVASGFTTLGNYGAIGARIGSTGTTYYMRGKIDQVRIFNKALSSSEVTTLYGETYASSTKSTTDIFNDGTGIALYELDEDASDTGVYTVGQGDIDSGQSADFNGGSEAYNTSVASNLTGDYSFGFYVKFDSLPTEGGLMGIYTPNTSNGTSLAFANGNLLLNCGNLQTATSISSGYWEINKWYHIAVTHDNGGDVKLYVNNILFSTLSTTSTTIQSGSTLILGRSSRTSSGSYNYVQRLNGQIDEVRVYNDVLTEAEVGYLAANDTVNIPTGNLVAHYKLDGNGNDQTNNNYSLTWSGTQLYSTNAEFPFNQYNGTPTNVNFLGMAFQPDLVWIKNRTSNWGHTLVDTVRGLNAASVYGALASDQTASETTNNVFGAIKSLDTNGFTTEGGSDVNGYYAVGRLNNDYVAWCWKAGGTVSANNNTDGNLITSTVSANQDAGFSIVKWTGDGNSSSTVGHGLSSKAELIIQKTLSTTGGWFVVSSELSNNEYLALQATIAATTDAGSSGAPASVNNNNDTTFGFRSGTVNVDNVNKLNDNYIAYCFHSVDGYQKVGSYTADNQTTKNITTGFRPRFLLLKRTNSAQNWVLVDSLRSNNELYANTGGSEATEASIPTFYDDGFTLHNTRYNGGTDNYIYLAIA